MSQVYSKMEDYFSKLGRWIYGRCYLSLALVLLVTLSIVMPLGQIQVDTSNDAFYHSSDEAKIAYDQFRYQFGKDDHLIVLLKPHEVFEPEFLQTLKQLRTEIEAEVPYLRKVTGIDNVRHTLGQNDELIVKDLIETVPDNPDEMAALKQLIFSNPYYVGYLISADAQYVAIDLEPHVITADREGYRPGSNRADEGFHYLSTREYREMMAALDPILDRYRQADLAIYVGGVPVITDRLTVAVEQTMVQLIPIAFLLNVAFLWLLFRRLSGVIYPVLIVLLTDITALGAMAWLNFPINLVTSILPSLLTVVGVADAVHILSGFYQSYNKNGGDKEQAIAYAMGRNGVAILMTSLTTAVGLLSFSTADIAPVAQLGIAAPIGIVLAFFYTIFLLPALIRIFPMAAPRVDSRQYALSEKLLSKVAQFSCSYYKSIIVFSSLLLVVAILGIVQLKLSHNALDWFPKNSIARSDNQTIDQALGGSVPVEVVINSQIEGGINEPAMMQKLDKAITQTMQLGSESVPIGKTNSLSLVVKEVNQALYNNQAEYYQVPSDRALIAQELLLFELGGGEDLVKLVDDNRSSTRFTLTLPYEDAIEIKPVVDQIITYFQSLLPQAVITITGLGPMYVETMYDVLSSMIKSYSIALVGISLLMIWVIGRTKLGLISMLPNLFPIALVLGLMGWLSLPFDFSNMLAGSIAIGLIVDDTIHFMYGFRRNFEQLGDVQAAVEKTLKTTGRAIFITSLVLASGFAASLFAELQSTANFGIVTAFAVIVALLADFFLIPALMTWVYGKNTTHIFPAKVISVWAKCYKDGKY